MIYNLLSGGEQGLTVLHPSQHLLNLVEIVVVVVRVSIVVEILIRVAMTMMAMMWSQQDDGDYYPNEEKDNDHS